MQHFEQYNVQTSNNSVNLYFIDRTQITHSSFEKSKILDKSKMIPVENFQLLYNFLIILPKTKTVQNYVIDINIHSRVAILEKNKEDRDTPFIFRYINTSTGLVDIKFVDYSVAN